MILWTRSGNCRARRETGDLVESLVCGQKNWSTRVQWFSQVTRWICWRFGSRTRVSALFLWQNAASRNKTKIPADYLSGKYDLKRGAWQEGWSEGTWFNQTSVAAETILGVQAANVTSCSLSREFGKRSKRQEISSVGRLCHSEPPCPDSFPLPKPISEIRSHFSCLWPWWLKFLLVP